jgi:hypothetical protein
LIPEDGLEITDQEAEQEEHGEQIVEGPSAQARVTIGMEGFRDTESVPPRQYSIPAMFE